MTSKKKYTPQERIDMHNRASEQLQEKLAKARKSNEVGDRMFLKKVYYSIVFLILLMYNQ